MSLHLLRIESAFDQQDASGWSANIVQVRNGMKDGLRTGLD